MFKAKLQYLIFDRKIFVTWPGGSKLGAPLAMVDT